MKNKLFTESATHTAIEQSADSKACDGCAFDYPSTECKSHACFESDFPKNHPLQGKRIVWVRKETA